MRREIFKHIMSSVSHFFHREMYERKNTCHSPCMRPKKKKKDGLFRYPISSFFIEDTFITALLLLLLLDFFFFRERVQRESKRERRTKRRFVEEKRLGISSFKAAKQQRDLIRFNDIIIISPYAALIT